MQYTPTQIPRNEELVRRLVHFFGEIQMKHSTVNFTRACQTATGLSSSTVRAIKQRAIEAGLLTQVTSQGVQFNALKSTPNYKTIVKLLTPKNAQRVVKAYITLKSFSDKELLSELKRRGYGKEI